MAAETALVIASLTVPMVIEMLSHVIGINAKKLERYYEASNAFRDYVNSLTADVQQELKDKEYKYTPSTAPRNDYAWATDEIKKRQDMLFKINQEIRALNEKESINQNQEYVGSDEYWKHGADAVGEEAAKRYYDKGQKWHEQDPISAAFNFIGEADNKDRFKQKKAQTSQKNNAELLKLNQKKQELTKPLVNTNPTYMSIQDRERNLKHAQKTIQRK